MAGVGDPDPDSAIAGEWGAAEGDPAPAGGVVEGVVDQVDKHLQDAVFVGDDGAGADIGDDLDAGGLGGAGELFPDQVDQLDDIDLTGFQFQGAGIGAGQLQQGADEAGEALQVGLQAGEGGLVFGGGARPGQGEVDLGAHQAEGGAELVGG